MFTKCTLVKKKHSWHFALNHSVHSSSTGCITYIYPVSQSEGLKLRTQHTQKNILLILIECSDEPTA